MTCLEDFGNFFGKLKLEIEDFQSKFDFLQTTNLKNFFTAELKSFFAFFDRSFPNFITEINQRDASVEVKLLGWIFFPFDISN